MKHFCPGRKDSADLFYLSTAIHTNSGLVGPFLNGRSLDNVYQLVVPGDQDVRAVHIGINPLAQDPFTLRLIDP